VISRRNDTEEGTTILLEEGPLAELARRHAQESFRDGLPIGSGRSRALTVMSADPDGASGPTMDAAQRAPDAWRT
jgi:hypothetical protein